MMDFFDRVVESLAPQQALKRLQARATIEAVRSRDSTGRGKRKYEGAAKGRHYDEWRTSSLSPNQEIMKDLAILRQRSRDLAKNNSYAINAIRTLRNNVVGTGIMPVPRGATKRQLAILKSAWEDWGGKTGCDFNDMSTIYGLQSLAFKVVIESGECLVRRVRGGSDDKYPLRLQLLEGDYIDSSHHTARWAGDDTIEFYGIRFDRSGRRLGYWLYKNHPCEFGGVSDFVPADDVVHIYEVEYPGQIRGVPFSCGVMLRLKDLEDYEFTERIRNKVAASFAVFVTDTAGSDAQHGGIDDMERIEPAMIKELAPGQDIKVAQPPASQGYAEYVKSNLRGIAAGYGTSYEALTSDYSNVNFSSGRMGWMEYNKNVEHLQWNLLIPRLCDKIYPWFVECCMLIGKLPFSADISVSWTPPRREMIDPAKEVQALKEGIRAGLYSWQHVVRTYGFVPEELKKELEEDKRMWDETGLTPVIDPRFDPNRQPVKNA